MIPRAEKIYVARSEWKLSFRQLAYLFDLSIEEVKDIYHKMLEKKTKKATITLDTSVDELNFDTRITNLLHRCHILTVKDLIKTDIRKFYPRAEVTIHTIQGKFDEIMPVLHLSVREFLDIFAEPGVEVKYQVTHEENCGYVKRWLVSDKVEIKEIRSITGRMKGYLKTIMIYVVI